MLVEKARAQLLHLLNTGFDASQLRRYFVSPLRMLADCVELEAFLGVQVGVSVRIEAMTMLLAVLNLALRAVSYSELFEIASRFGVGVVGDAGLG